MIGRVAEAARHFTEARLTKRRRQPVVGERIRHLALDRVDRIAFQPARPASPSVRGCLAQQGDRQPTPSVSAGDEKAHHRPDRFVIDRLQDARVLEQPVFLASCQRHPARRHAVHVCQQPRLAAAGDQSPERPPVGCAALALELRPALAEEHAPASGTRAPWPEQLHQVVPSIRRHRTNDDLRLPRPGTARQRCTSDRRNASTAFRTSSSPA